MRPERVGGGEARGDLEVDEDATGWNVEAGGAAEGEGGVGFPEEAQ